MTNRSLNTTLSRSVLVLCLALMVSGCNWVKRVSMSSTGEQANGLTYSSATLSVDGRFVVFCSEADNLVPDDTNGATDVFVHDTLNGTTSRVSVDSAGNQGNASSFNLYHAISDDGRYVAFLSAATNLVTGDTNGNYDVFLHDRTTGTTTLVDSAGYPPGEFPSPDISPVISGDGRYVAFQSYFSAPDRWEVHVYDRLNGTRAGIKANTFSGNPSISRDGRYVAFDSPAANLVAGDTNNTSDIFVHDMLLGTTSRVSVDSAGYQGNNFSISPSISADGRFVAFESRANNLVSGDFNESWDVFVHDSTTGTTTRASVDSAGYEANGWSTFVDISGDGRYVVYQSAASNLVAGGTYFFNIFVHDRATGATSRVSADAQGPETYADNVYPSISANGRYVAFGSTASNVVAGDTNGLMDVFIRAIPEVTVTSVTPHDLPIGVTTAVTVSGANFLPGATPLLSGAQLGNIVIVNENTITMNAKVNANAPLGAKDLSVGLPGTGAGPLTGSLGNCINCVTFVPKPPTGC